jgi:hypothetical protein
METLYAFCDCFGWIETKEAVLYLLDEVGEFLWHPSLDEASDICFAMGRLLGTLAGKKYVNVPGDFLTIEKMRDRMMTYGCIQSERHLVYGKCPSLKS